MIAGVEGDTWAAPGPSEAQSKKGTSLHVGNRVVPALKTHRHPMTTVAATITDACPDRTLLRGQFLGPGLCGSIARSIDSMFLPSDVDGH